MQIYINHLEEKDYSVSIYGGEYADNEVEFASYGIQIGDDFSFEISPQTAVDLYNKLGEHLKTNHRIK